MPVAPEMGELLRCQAFPDVADEVNKTLPPWQKVNAVVVVTTGAELNCTKIGLEVAEQPLALVVFTV